MKKKTFIKNAYIRFRFNFGLAFRQFFSLYIYSILLAHVSKVNYIYTKPMVRQ